MKETKRDIFDLDIIDQTINKLAGIVIPSMGAKGRMALIERGAFDKPLITDDGVTIAKESMKVFTHEERPIYSLCIEALHNVEKTAFDGTTLTILMIKAFHQYAKRLTKEGVDQQLVSEAVLKRASEIVKILDEMKMTEVTPEIIENVATVATKIKQIGKMIAETHKIAGNEMNIVIQHDQSKGDYIHTIKAEDGYVLEDEGYHLDENVNFTTDDKRSYTEYEHARLVFLSSGGFEFQPMLNFFKSLPTEDVPPLIFFLPKQYDANTLLNILNIMIESNKKFAETGQESRIMRFQFVYLHKNTSDRKFRDLAAYTNGVIQDEVLGTKDYKFENCGFAKKIIIYKGRTIILKEDQKNNAFAVDARVKEYNEYLERNKFQLMEVDRVDIIKSISALTSSIVKIMLAVPTRSEYEFLKLKFDDAIGTVKMTIRNGYLLGGGKSLFNVGKGFYSQKNKEILEITQAPIKQITSNAGYKFKDVLKSGKLIGEDYIFNVMKGKWEPASEEGIYDSYEAYRSAILNASSVVSQLILTYVYIK
ncbi:MAG: TCP-1/cpn60 chaperonin family protein [Candidatus Izemoplasmatales bacterium]|nr:TCP-1/cpn60 chaperonin family protein [Candidatus Izemoplasmatales bacterium]